MLAACAKGSPSRSRPPIAPAWRRSSPTATAARSTCGGPGSCWPPPKAAARSRSPAGPASPSRASGDGRSASCARACPALLRDKTRKPGRAPLAAATVKRVVELTLKEPPGETTHWTGRAMAEAAGVSLRSVQRVWKAHRLTPHRVRTFKLSRDPAFVAKLRGVVGLYMHPPAHAIVLSVDEKSQAGGGGARSGAHPLPDRDQPRGRGP